MKFINKIAAAALLSSVLFGACACGEVKKENDTVDRSRLFGLGYIGLEWEIADPDFTLYEKAFALMNNMGVRSIRNWMQASWLLESPAQVNEKNCAIMHNILAEAAKYDIQVVGMSHTWFTGVADMGFVPYRETEAGTWYMNWLLNYDKSWETLAREFPEVELWEIGNELNNNDFIHPQGHGTDGESFTMRQKAAIATDMLYYGTRGVRRGNPNAKTVMGGLSSGDGFYTGKDANFLEEVYLNIESGEWPSADPNDYFDYLAWHPYSFEKEPDDSWVEMNDRIFEVSKRHEGREKKVFLTEYGLPDTTDLKQPGALLERNGQWVMKGLELIEQRMPYVESVHVFRMFDCAKDYSWGGIGVTSYGLFHDPLYSDGDAKSTAFAYQALAGGKGALDLAHNASPKKNPYF